MHQQGSIAGQYQRMCADREHFLDRARDCSAVTIPTVVPPEGFVQSSDIHVPFQGLGARGVNNLSSTLLLSILPPSSPFFRLTLTPEARALVGEDHEALAEIDTALSLREQAVMREIERQGLRNPLHSALRHLLISGNVVIYHRPEGGFRLFPLDSFVIKRSGRGQIECLITHETVSVEDLRQQLEDEEIAAIEASPAGQGAMKRHSDLDMYCRIERRDGGYVKELEVAGVKIDSADHEWGEDEGLPYLAPRMITIDGEAYGRSYVEEYLGELRSLEGLQQAIVSASAAAAKVLFLVDPSGLTRPKDLSDTPNLAVRSGRAADVSTLQLQKFADMRVAFESIQNIEQRLSYAFMLVEAGIRNAERVTAEEVRRVQQAVERQLGGVYSLISSEIQVPLIELVMEQMQSALPEVPTKYVDKVIITGVEALGRAADSARLDAFIAGGLQTFGPQFVEYLNMPEFARRRAASLGIEHKGLVKSEEQLAQERQMAAQAQAAQMANQEAIGVAGSVAKEALTAPQE